MAYNEKRYLDLAGLIAYDEKIKKYIDDADNAQDAIAAALKKVVEENSSAITVLNGTGDGSVAKTVATAITALVNGAPEALNTLGEIALWIAEDETRAAELIAKDEQLSQKITDLKNLLGELPAEAGQTTVISYLKGEIDQVNKTLTAAVKENTSSINTVSGRVDKVEEVLGLTEGDGTTKTVAEQISEAVNSEKSRAEAEEAKIMKELLNEETRVGTIPASSSSKTVIDYIKEQSELATNAANTNTNTIINSLNNTATSTAGGVTVSVVQEKGAITSISATVAEGIYDASGEAKSAYDAIGSITKKEINDLFPSVVEVI